MHDVEFQIRPFDRVDADAVWALHNEALEDAGAHGGNGPWDDDVRDPDSAYRIPGGELLVGLLRTELVAMGGFRPTSPHSAEITRMRVAPRHQGKGLGTRILQELERRARELGCWRLHLDTTAQQKAAQQFYRSQGYSEVRRAVEGAFEFIFYEKEIASDTHLERDETERG